MHKQLLKSILLTLLAVWLVACDSSNETHLASPTALNPTVTSALMGAPTIGSLGTASLPATIEAKASPTKPSMAVAPQWARDAVLYQVFVRDFTQEGTLVAAEKRLTDLQDLGVNVIYLMPIHPIGVVKRKGTLGSPYSIQDYIAIDHTLGTEADLKSFVNKAHSLKMHVIMDLVANHTSWDNVLTIQHPDWYKHDTAGNFVPPNPDWSDVIQLDHSKPALLQYMTDMTTHYMRDDGVDGFRCDYSVGVPIAFWLSLQGALKQANPDVFLLSENDDQVLTSAFDATYDQDTYKDMLTAYLSHRPQGLLISPLTDQELYGDKRLRTRFLENHDHDRVAYTFRKSPDGLKVLSTYLLTTNGIPFIENGQEVAITHTISLFEADKIDWASGDTTLRDQFKKLIAVRNANPALRHGDIAKADSGDPNVMGFLRTSQEQQVLVLISFAADQKHITPGNAITAKQSKDLETGAAVNLEGGLDMPAWSWRIIELK